MKYLLALLLALPVFAHADDWNTTDKIIGSVALGATFIDWGQTRWIAEHCNPQERLNCGGEANPILGKHPQMGHVNAYFAVVPVAAFFIADNLSQGHRTVFLSVCAGIEVAVVAHNYHVGYRTSF